MNARTFLGIETMIVTSSTCTPVLPTLAAIALTVAATVSGSAASAEIRVVASIKPVHSLASAVMAGAGEPRLLIRGTASPHGYTLRPSDAAALSDADVVLMIDEALETSLARAVAGLARNARVVALSETPDLIRLPYRDPGLFKPDAHEDDDNGHAAAEDHGLDDAAPAGHSEGGTADHDGHDGNREEVHAEEGTDEHAHDHGHGEFDLHVWLDPVNGTILARAISDALSEADPANAHVYSSNARTLLARLDTLTEQVARAVAPARGRPFVVFHDGYRYFENRFGLTPVGSVVINPEQPPGVRRIRELRATMRELHVECVFAEPQFNQGLVDVLLEGTGIGMGNLDPLGAEIEDGPELYFTLLANMASEFRQCLEPEE